jgi:hypothetical protein
MEVGVASIDGRCAHPSNIKIQKAGAEGSLSMLSSLPASDLGVRPIREGGGTSQPENSAIMGLMSTLEEIEAAVQQLPPAKRAEFRAWFLSFDASDWDQQMEDDLTAGKLDWIANEAISDSQSGRCSEL